MKRALIASIALLASACGAAPHEPSAIATDEPQRDLAGYDARVDELLEELDGLMANDVGVQILSDDPALGESETCRAGADIRDRICDLARRICELAERDPSAADTAQKCQRATMVCSEARDRVRGTCGARR